MAKNETGTNMKFTFDNLKSLLSMLVIPLVLWGVKLEVNNAVMVQDITRLQADVQADENQVSAIKQTVQKNSVALAQLKERIDAANSTLQDIKNILRDRRNNDGN